MRIIAGDLKGRKILVSKSSTLRPTTGRVREAVFSILGPVTDLKVLDLFCGSGAVGFEALSRGAASCSFVDSGRDLKVRQNIELLRLDEVATLYNVEVEEFLSHAALFGPWDLIYVDPPYDLAAGYELLLAKQLKDLLSPQGRVVMETAKNKTLDFPLEKVLTRRYGDSMVTVYKKI